MKETFSTNKTLVIFLIVLSLIVFVPGLINMYRIVTDSGSYYIGFKSIIAIVMPIITFFAYRNGLLAVEDDGIKLGRNFYPFKDYTFRFDKKELASKDRPITSFWKKDYDVLRIASRTTSVEQEESIDMSREKLDRLRSLIDNRQPSRPR